MNSDEQQIRQLIDKWGRATAAGDLQTVLHLMADDAIFLTPGQPPMNKQAFAAAFKGFSGRARVESKPDVKEVYAVGDLAYCWSHISVVMTSLDTGERKERAGYALTVFRKSPNGSWVISRDANLLV
ncbi:MAG TPA: SgcJ/EcaC family oxidoreductase [Thermoanaerobaculia bacterium]|jgi:uncharacterized protein (TIGR02246 family)